MARNKPSIAYLDTHIVVWLYAGLTDRISDAARQAIEGNDLLISQLVRLELQYLFEIGRITARPDTIIKNLFTAIGLRVSETPLQQIIDQAIKINWTRDVFDRMLAAESMATGGGFITADVTIKSNFKLAIW